MKGDRLPSSQAFAEFRDIFHDAHAEFALDRFQEHELAGVLDGQASAELRRLVSLTDRRELGAFFTPHELADRLAEPLSEARGEGSSSWTRVAAQEICYLPPPEFWHPRSVGQRRRCVCTGWTSCQSSWKWRLGDSNFSAAVLNVDLEVRVRCGDGRLAPEVAGATHLLLNPPYASVQSSDDCEWAGGRVNGAADFLDRTVARLAPGSRVSALLPDVLRSGARYGQWRRLIGESLDIEETTILGQFDRWADVDVFLLRAVRRARPDGSAPESWVGEASGPTVGGRFHVSVGPVVHYRAPNRGPRRPYLTAKDFPTWGTIRRVARDRRFIGRLHSGPFVAVPRTSRPEEPARARGAIVADHRAVAVDNHLLVLSPLSGGIDECHRLLAVLRSEAANAWLNRAIRCRHLTVGAVASLPWVDTGVSHHAG